MTSLFISSFPYFNSSATRMAKSTKTCSWRKKRRRKRTTARDRGDVDSRLFEHCFSRRSSFSNDFLWLFRPRSLLLFRDSISHSSWLHDFSLFPVCSSPSPSVWSQRPLRLFQNIHSVLLRRTPPFKTFEYELSLSSNEIFFKIYERVNRQFNLCHCQPMSSSHFNQGRRRKNLVIYRYHHSYLYLLVVC